MADSKTTPPRPAPEKKTIIEDGTVFKGTLSANCPVVVRGQVEGEIRGPSLDVAESGAVSGKVKVTELRSRGELTGTFEADDVVLCGRVRDQTVIIAKTLEVASPKSGSLAVELAECELQIGEVPSKQAALRDALSGGAGHLAAAGAAQSGNGESTGAVVAAKAPAPATSNTPI
ncbi:MAG TPA: polymer-forming cytoskeletal protein [Polyangia bacterium]|nr:polymer-forming cytoskeletal protein [Polyangia bacterium]